MSKSPQSIKITDLSKYTEKEGDEDPNFWNDLSIPSIGFQPHNVAHQPNALSSAAKEASADFSHLPSSLSSIPCGRNQDAFIGNVTKFLSTYRGPGSVTRLTGNKRSVSSETSDWDEDIQVPSSGFPSRPRTFSELDDLDSLLSGEQDPILARIHPEPILKPQIGGGGKTRRLSSPPDATLEINFDEELAHSLTSHSVQPSTAPKENLSPYTRESSTETWDDIVVPTDVTALKVVQRKPYQPTRNAEESWLEDIEIPNDDIFTAKVAQKRFQTRKHARTSRHLQRNPIKFEVNLSRMRESYNYPPRPHGAKDPPKASDGAFHYRQKLGSKSLVSFFTTPASNIKTTISDPATPEHRPLYLPKLRHYGDGTELDGFDNLPVPITPKSRHTSKKMLRIDPRARAEAPAERYSQLLDQFSEIEVERDGLSNMAKVKPHLIQNLNSLRVERVVGDMKFNPQTQTWEGNEQALKDFDAVSPPRPALITNLNGNKRPRRVGNMIFDPEQMRWFSVAAEADPFADIPDLTTRDPPITRKRAGAGTSSFVHLPFHPRPFRLLISLDWFNNDPLAPGDSFFLSAKAIDTLYAAERQHRHFMSAWCEATPAVGGRGIGYAHLFDIRDFPANF
ncbi:hypothetical protein L0F63_004906 [Massospora cicadina]|nr:hypothetical protein L0F63_004906 [Massospora cicadina]